MKEARRLLENFLNPTEHTFRTAQDHLNRIVMNSESKSRSAKDSFLFLLSCFLAQRTLPGYATLDYEHIREIQLLLDTIKRYHEDVSRKRPLNFLMLASPGAGKSHFIRCIAAKLGTQNIGTVMYNMVGLQRHEDLIPPLDAARNFKVEDRLPLLFLDEFDIGVNHFPLLLPLLWDGRLTLGQHDLKLGKVVIVLAGSDPSLPAAMEHARSMNRDAPQPEGHQTKLVDLLSRINGSVLRIPQLSDPTHLLERRADKICIAVELLRQRFGSTLDIVPLALLHFIALSEFRYGVRSIAHLIDLIPYTEDLVALKLAKLKLPLDDPDLLKSTSLAYHMLCEDQAHGVVKTWKKSTRIGAHIPTRHEMFLHFPEPFRWDFSTEWLLSRLWPNLEEDSSSNRPQRRR